MEVYEIVLGILRTLGPAALALVGALVGCLISLRIARKSDVRWSREESMRMLRWATELSLDTDWHTSKVGLAVLVGLLESTILQEVDRPFVTTVAATAKTRSFAVALGEELAASYNILNTIVEEH